jgi:hypothetical protein
MMPLLPLVEIPSMLLNLTRMDCTLSLFLLLSLVSTTQSDQDQVEVEEMMQLQDSPVDIV